MDSGNVIKGLELCEIGSGDRCYETECPYYGQGCTESLKNDILALLKEQEAKTVQVIGNVGVSDVKFADCPWCAMRIHDDESQCYCGHCGQAVKWE